MFNQGLDCGADGVKMTGICLFQPPDGLPASCEKQAVLARYEQNKR
jgi:hypothetical protein